VDLVVRGGEPVIDEVWCPRPFDLSRPVTDLHCVDEQALLAAARAGDEEAFGRLVERHREGLEQFCSLMLGDAHDGACALEEAVLTAWRERELVQPVTTARMWLYRIAMIACLEDLDLGR
jgi:hypothetical protein